MLKDERYNKILEILENEKYISAKDLSKRLFVSMPTIRRDLSELQKKNLLLRSHGGAKKINAEHIVMPLDFRKTVNSQEKKRLSKAASKLINDNDIVFIDASTTVLQIAEFLSDKNQVTVITNGIPLAMLLSKKGIKTYCTGGEIQGNSLAYAGSFAEEFIRKFNIDIAFFSCHGINDKGMIIDTSLSETQFRKALINQSKKSVFLCDSKKFNLSAPYNLIPLKDVDYIITNSDNIKNFLPEKSRDNIIIV